MCAPQQTEPQTAASQGTACNLISKAEIEQAVKTTVNDGFPHKDKQVETCAFRNPQGDQIGIFVSRSNDKRDLDVLVAKTKEALPHAKIRELPGLGQKAILVDNPGKGTMLTVYRGGDALLVLVYVTEKGVDADAAAEIIARKAFKRF